ncbi:hypothetical protein GCM10010264_70860 [Streptomyces globisporus]|nr:hypothetical protein GCM10010264_70860 [Streptomyces globisporus]
MRHRPDGGGARLPAPTQQTGHAMTDNAVKGPASYFPSIEKKYGRPVAEWKGLIRTSPLTKHGELVGWLTSEHGLGHGHANALVAHTLAEDSAR